MEQEEEDENESWEDLAREKDSMNGVLKPRSYDVIAKEYFAARSEAAKAKGTGDKKSKEQAGQTIRKLKQELTALGLTDEILASDFENERAFVHESTETSSDFKSQQADETTKHDAGDLNFLQQPNESTADGNDSERCSINEFPIKSSASQVPVQDKATLEDNLEDVELGGFFLEDVPASEALPAELLKLQKKEELRALCGEFFLEKLEGIWKKVQRVC